MTRVTKMGLSFNLQAHIITTDLFVLLLMSSLTDPWCQSLSQCPDSTCKQDLLAYLQRIALYCHQLNICSKVKAEVQNLGGELVVSGVSLTLFKRMETLSTVYSQRCAKDPRVKPIRCICNVFLFFFLIWCCPNKLKIPNLAGFNRWFMNFFFPALCSLYFISIKCINSNGCEADIIAFSVRKD